MTYNIDAKKEVDDFIEKLDNESSYLEAYEKLCDLVDNGVVTLEEAEELNLELGEYYMIESEYSKKTKNEWGDLKYKIKNKRDIIKTLKKNKKGAKLIIECDKFIILCERAIKKIESIPYTQADQLEDFAKFMGVRMVVNSAIEMGMATYKTTKEVNGRNKLNKLAQAKLKEKGASAQPMKYYVDHKGNAKTSLAKGAIGAVGDATFVYGKNKLFNGSTEAKASFATYRNKIINACKKNIKWARKQKEYGKQLIALKKL